MPSILFQTHAYELAAKIPGVLHQQPCYCYCDRGMGHNSLHSCFEDTHGAQCSVCLKELITPTHEPEGQDGRPNSSRNHKGEWKQIDLQTAAIPSTDRRRVPREYEPRCSQVDGRLESAYNLLIRCV